MKKSILSIVVLSIILLNSCKKDKAPLASNLNTSGSQKTELLYNPGNATKAKEITLNFIRHTKFSTNKTTEVFPDAPIFEGAYLLEAGANYLRNTNFKTHYSLTQSFDKSIDKINPTTLSGASMVQSFEDLMAEIGAYEDGSNQTGYLINGYITSQDNDIATVRFDVYFGEPDNSPTYIYPNQDQTWCDAATTLTNGINFDLQYGNVFATGVISQNPGVTGGATHPDSFYDGKAWSSSVAYGIFANEWTTWHNNGLAIANHFANGFCQQNNPNNPTAGCVVPVNVNINCGSYGVNPTFRYHTYYNITLAQFLASY
jgi:hypothetical protein